MSHLEQRGSGIGIVERSSAGSKYGAEVGQVTCGKYDHIGVISDVAVFYRRIDCRIIPRRILRPSSFKHIHPRGAYGPMFVWPIFYLKHIAILVLADGLS